jgi:hypothetical protein
MFPTTAIDEKVIDPVVTTATKPSSYPVSQNHMNMTSLDTLLETERQSNKKEPWNKLDKTRKTHILHCFAEKYVLTNDISRKEIDNLSLFFNTCLEKGKLIKANDVSYNRETHEIESISSLLYISEKQKFILKNTESKRVSTLKSMTPKRNVSIDSKRSV